jgi:hypothetical protein
VSLHDVIWASQSRRNIGVLQTPLDPWRRAPASDEIFDFSFMDYFYVFLRPCYEEQRGAVASEEEMFALSDARSLEADLRADGRVRVFVNANDFLLADFDRDWLAATFGPDHVTIRPRGGHAGTLYQPRVQAEIMAALRDLLDPPP